MYNHSKCIGSFLAQCKKNSPRSLKVFQGLLVLLQVQLLRSAPIPPHQEQGHQLELGIISTTPASEPQSQTVQSSSLSSFLGSYCSSCCLRRWKTVTEQKDCSSSDPLLTTMFAGEAEAHDRLLIQVVSYNVLFSVAWDPDADCNQITQDGAPHVRHAMSKYSQNDWKRVFGYQEDAANKALKLGQSTSALPLNHVESFSRSELADPAIAKKLEPFLNLYGQQQRLERVLKKLDEQMKHAEPVFTLSEVTRKWAPALAHFFETRGYFVHYVSGWEDGFDYFGLLVAFPKTWGEATELLVGPVLDDVTAPSADEIQRFLDNYSKGGGEEFRFSGEEIAEIYDEVLFGELRRGASEQERLTQDMYHTTTAGDRPFRLPTRAPTGTPGLFLKMRPTPNKFFLLAFYHMPMRVFWRTPTSNAFAGDTVMALHSIAVRHKIQHLLEHDDMPLVLLGDWNTFPNPKSKNYKYLTGRDPDTDELVNWDAPDDEATLLANLLLSGSEERSTDHRPRVETKISPAPLRLAYAEVHGGPPEVTSRTQEFCGSLDHAFVSAGVEVLDALEMPKLTDLEEQEIYHPNLPSGEVVGEPSDHLLQSMVIGI